MRKTQLAMRKPTVPSKQITIKPQRKEVIFINRKDLPKPNTTCQTCGHQYYVCTKCLKLRTSGIETWRQYCDCIECYQLYVFLGKDVKDIDKEEYERMLAIELPDGKTMTKEVKAKMDAIKQYFEPSTQKASLQERQQNNQAVNQNQNKQNLNKKNNSNSKYLFNNKRH